MTAPELKGVATLDIANFRRNVGKVRGDLRDITDYAKKNGTLALTLKLSGTSLAAAKAQIDAAVGGRNLPFKVTFDPVSVKAAVAALRTTLSGVTSINTSALTAVQAQVNGQIAQLTALIAQLRALGGGGGGGGSGRGSGRLSAGTQILLNDLEKLNQEYKRGDVNANQYATRLAGLQSALRVAAATATAGTAEFRALDRAVTATVQGMRGIETARITSLKTELSGARAQFDAAAAAATNLAQRRAAIAAYEGDLGRIRVALQGMATSGRLTEQQLGAVNRMLAQTARESQTIKGKVNIAGLSGNIGNALQQISGYVPGMAQLGGVINSLPPGLLAAAAGATALASGLAASFKTAADFQQEMANINALTRPTGEELKTLTDTALNFGIPLGVGARAAAAGILELNKAGLSAQQVIGGGLAAALNLAAAAGINTSESAKLVVTAMTAFKLSAADLPKIADIFAGFANQTVLDASDLGLALAAVGPVAKSSGLALNDFAGYMATLAQGGFRSMSDAGTSLKTVLLNLQAPSTTAAKAMAQVGLNTYDANGRLLPFRTSLENLRKSLSGLSDQEKNNVLLRIFGQDGIRAATILLKESQSAIDGNIESIEKQGDAAGVAKTR
uniref:phage tail tape measure protein n=1 Tax=uncultured Deinococcus sp. TaxID=158789 RepID=UPI0025841292